MLFISLFDIVNFWYELFNRVWPEILKFIKQNSRLTRNRIALKLRLKSRNAEVGKPAIRIADYSCSRTSNLTRYRLPAIRTPFYA